MDLKAVLAHTLIPENLIHAHISTWTWSHLCRSFTSGWFFDLTVPLHVNTNFEQF